MQQMALIQECDAALVRAATKEAKEGRQLDFQEVWGAELLGMLTGMGSTQAQEVMRTTNSLSELAQMPIEMLVTLPGVGVKRAEKIRAMSEWAGLLHRHCSKEQLQVRTPADVANMLMMEMQPLTQEELHVVGLDTKNYVMFVEMVYRGTLNEVRIRVGEVFRKAVMSNCAGIVVVHNHPSGDPTPSPEDVRVTRNIREAGALMNINVLDHVIIGNSRFTSMKERRLGFGD